MKKISSILLVLALSLSLAAVPLAASGLRPSGEGAPTALFVDAAHPLLVEENGAATASDLVSRGKTYCYALCADEAGGEPVTRLSDLDGIRVSAKWEEGGAHVRSVSLVRRTIEQNGERTNGCFVAVEAFADETEPVDVAGTIALKGSLKTAAGKTPVDLRFDAAFTVGYERVTLHDGDDEAEIDETPRLYDLEDCGEEEFTFTFGEAATAVVDVSKTDEAVLSCNTDDIPILNVVYNKAALSVVSLKGKFRRTATVTLYARPEQRLYEYRGGYVTPVDAVYDEDEEGFVFRTKVLGTYVLSDTKLPRVKIGQAEGTAVPAPANPATGAA